MPVQRVKGKHDSVSFLLTAIKPLDVKITNENLTSLQHNCNSLTTFIKQESNLIYTYGLTDYVFETSLLIL